MIKFSTLCLVGIVNAVTFAKTLLTRCVFKCPPLALMHVRRRAPLSDCCINNALIYFVPTPKLSAIRARSSSEEDDINPREKSQVIE